MNRRPPAAVPRARLAGFSFAELVVIGAMVAAAAGLIAAALFKWGWTGG